jgi:Helicase associated domain
MKLGTLVDSIRRGLSYADRKEELSAMGFNFEQQTQSAYGFETVYAALCRFNELEGHMLVPRSYSVPSSSEWPKDTWGMKLGTHVNSIRNGRSYVDKRAELLNIGFIYDTRKSLDVQSDDGSSSSSSSSSSSCSSSSSSSSSSRNQPVQSGSQSDFTASS